MKELYLAKIKILQEALELTESVSFRKDKDDADVYIDFIAKRGALFDRAKEIDGKLAQGGYTGKEPEAGEYKQKISAISRQIVARDNYMKDAVSKMLADAKSDVKNINTGKSLVNIYSGGASGLGRPGSDWSR